MLAHQQYGDAAGQAAQRGRGDARLGREDLVGRRGGDLVPYSGVGEARLGNWAFGLAKVAVAIMFGEIEGEVYSIKEARKGESSPGRWFATS